MTSRRWPCAATCRPALLAAVHRSRALHCSVLFPGVTSSGTCTCYRPVSLSFSFCFCFSFTFCVHLVFLCFASSLSQPCAYLTPSKITAWCKPELRLPCRCAFPEDLQQPGDDVRRQDGSAVGAQPRDQHLPADGAARAEWGGDGSRAPGFQRLLHHDFPGQDLGLL